MKAIKKIIAAAFVALLLSGLIVQLSGEIGAQTSAPVISLDAPVSFPVDI